MKKTLIKHELHRKVGIGIEPSASNPAVLQVTRKSDATGHINQMDLPVTEGQLRQWLGDEDHPGELLQRVMPHLSTEQRMFLDSGCTPEEWANIVKGEE